MKANSLRDYKCPKVNDIHEPKVPALINFNKGSTSTVSGRYCKNNCKHYFVDCKKFNKN